MEGDTPKVAKRREREKRVVSQMVAIYCRLNHKGANRSCTGFCGEPLCPECLEVDGYAVLRTERCRQMEGKATCEKCGRHCYKPDEREKIRAIMRFSGPRMIVYHPVEAVRHLLGK